MMRDRIATIREDYDQIAEEYASRLFRELEGKPLDRVHPLQSSLE